MFSDRTNDRFKLKPLLLPLLLWLTQWHIGIACASELKPIKQIDAWSYYNSPPFLTDEGHGDGLCRDLVNYLNAKLAGQYKIELSLIPRARLNAMLERGTPGVVVFAPSVVFGGIESGRYLWSLPLLADRQMIISLQRHPIEFTGASALYGINLGGVLGHIYPAIQTEIDAGRIQLQRPANERSLYNMLLFGHVEAITLAETSIKFLSSEQPQSRASLYYSRGDLGKFTRHLLFQPGMESARADFNVVIENMARDPAWLAILAKYGLSPSQ